MALTTVKLPMVPLQEILPADNATETEAQQLAGLMVTVPVASTVTVLVPSVKTRAGAVICAQAGMARAMPNRGRTRESCLNVEVLN